MNKKKMLIITVPIILTVGVVYAVFINKEEVKEKPKSDIQKQETEVKDVEKEKIKTEINRVFEYPTITYSGLKKENYYSVLFNQEIPLDISYTIERKPEKDYITLNIKSDIEIPNKIKKYRLDLDLEIENDKKEKTVMIRMTDFKNEWKNFKTTSVSNIEDAYLNSLGLTKTDYRALMEEIDGLFQMKYGVNEGEEEIFGLTYSAMKTEYGYDMNDWMNLFEEEKKDYIRTVGYVFGEKESRRIIKNALYKMIDESTKGEVEEGVWNVTNGKFIEYIEKEIESKKNYYEGLIKNEELRKDGKWKERLDETKANQKLEENKKIEILKNEEMGYIEKITIKENDVEVWTIDVKFQVQEKQMKSGEYKNLKLSFGYKDKEEALKTKMKEMNEGKLTPIEPQKQEEAVNEEGDENIDNQSPIASTDPLGKVSMLEQLITWGQGVENAAGDGNVYVNYEVQTPSYTAKKQALKNAEGTESILTYEYVTSIETIKYFITWEEGLQMHNMIEIIDGTEINKKGVYENGVFQQK